jgi:hypothetical protein
MLKPGSSRLGGATRDCAWTRCWARKEAGRCADEGRGPRGAAAVRDARVCRRRGRGGTRSRCCCLPTQLGGDGVGFGEQRGAAGAGCRWRCADGRRGAHGSRSPLSPVVADLAPPPSSSPVMPHGPPSSCTFPRRPHPGRQTRARGRRSMEAELLRGFSLDRHVVWQRGGAEGKEDFCSWRVTSHPWRWARCAPQALPLRQKKN